MRSFILSSLLPLAILACDNAQNDACLGAMNSASGAAAFCLTYTQAANTATTGLPDFASACSSKTKKISSACSCLVTNTLATVVANSTGYTNAAPTVSTTTANATVAAHAYTLASTSIATKTPITSTSVSVAVVTQAAVASTAASAQTGTACTVTDYPGISSAVASCTNIVLQDIAMPESTTHDLTYLQNGTTVTFTSNTSFATTVDSDFSPIEITGTNVLITGASGYIIDGNGPSYWDARGDEPNSASGDDAATHNSDELDISSSDTVTLSNTVVRNQDDCVAVTSGSNITITGMTCSGGHGLSIGSVGGKSHNTVSGITFSDSTVTDSGNGCRVKSNSDTTGTIDNIVYKNIFMSGISGYGIDIQQDYLNGGATGDPTDGVTISNVSFTNVTGTATSSAYDYYILCGSDSCSDFSLSDVSITGGWETSSCNYPSTGCPS